MSRPTFRSGALALIALAALWTPARAATVQQMNLEDMVGRAGAIFRGTVLDVREGTLQAGGGEIPTVTYRLRVDEAFKGTFQEVKGERIAEVRMIGTLKPAEASGAVRQLPVLPELPRLQVGSDYLLLTTPPSVIGLSTTVGLGQGAFQLTGKPGQELALNGNANLGLFSGMNGASRTAVAAPESGPLPYSVLADTIRAIVE